MCFFSNGALTFKLNLSTLQIISIDVNLCSCGCLYHYGNCHNYYIIHVWLMAPRPMLCLCHFKVYLVKIQNVNTTAFNIVFFSILMM